MGERALRSSRGKKLASIRISSAGYLAVAAVMTFTALVCLRTHRDLPAVIIIFSTWTMIPILIFSDRLSFDGINLRRTGLSAFIQRTLLRRVLNVAVDDIERVEVSSCARSVVAAMFAIAIGWTWWRVIQRLLSRPAQTFVAWCARC